MERFFYRLKGLRLAAGAALILLPVSAGAMGMVGVPMQDAPATSTDNGQAASSGGDLTSNPAMNDCLRQAMPNTDFSSGGIPHLSAEEQARVSDALQKCMADKGQSPESVLQMIGQIMARPQGNSDDEKVIDDFNKQIDQK